MSETATSVIARKLVHNLEMRTQRAVERELRYSCAALYREAAILVVLDDDTDVSLVAGVYLAVDDIRIETQHARLREFPRNETEQPAPFLADTITLHAFSRKTTARLDLCLYTLRQVQRHVGRHDSTRVWFMKMLSGTYKS